MLDFFKVIFYVPLYNGLIGFLNIIPGADMGVAVILFTILVKLVLFPLSYKSVKTQIQMKRYEPELKRIREKYADNKQEQALKTMELYKSAGINPFASFFLLLIQLPILISLYYAFAQSGLPVVNTEILYSFVHSPQTVSMTLFGIIDLVKKNITLSILAALTTYFQIKLSTPPMPPKIAGSQSSFGDDLARTMSTQMKYVYPVMVLFISYGISGAVALYWTISNIFTILQELYVRRKFTSEKPVVAAE